MLNWDLRPVTVYDFVRAFCNLLLPGGESSGASGSSSAGTGSSGVAVTLQSKEEKEKELERLRVGAEDIADLASFGGWLVLGCLGLAVSSSVCTCV